jgi:microcystin degradation protein MlrC
MLYWLNFPLTVIKETKMRLFAAALTIETNTFSPLPTTPTKAPKSRYALAARSGIIPAPRSTLW